MSSGGGGRARARKRIFVGDVQGCADELHDLLDVVAFDPDVHELWFVGDLVNRGPDSLGVLRMVRALGADSVLGNHDLHLLALAKGIRAPRVRDTLAPVLAADDRDGLLAWLRERPLVRVWDDLVLVHAGLHPDWHDPVAVARPLEARIRAGEVPIGDPALEFLTHVRYCNRAGELFDASREEPEGYAPWDAFYAGTRRVVFGHWSTRGVVATDRVRGLDSGCVWGGRLTAWIAEEDRFVSVPARRVYCAPSFIGG